MSSAVSAADPIPPGIPALGAGSALVLDFDGTLVDIAARPDAVQVEPGLPELLSDLRRQLGGALAITK